MVRHDEVGVRGEVGARDVVGFNVADGTSADGKQLNNTAATAKVGDEITVVYSAKANGPSLTAMKGILLREA